MYQPQTYAAALLFMVASMICWGSWANTMKLAPGWRFQLYYWDYVAGILVASILWGLSLGSTDRGPQSLVANLAQASTRSWLNALVGGAIFNIANLLLVAAIELAGLAVAFPIGIGLALVVGVLLNYALAPRGNPFLLFGGVLLVVTAIVLDAAAYRRKESAPPAITARAIAISIACGILMGLFYPFVTRASTGAHPLGPYAVAVVFAIGIVLCALPANYFLMRRPITAGPPLSMHDYVRGRAPWHIAGLSGGIIWCTGTVLNFVAGRAQIIGPAISYAIGQGATLVSAVWGVLVWREFRDAPRAAGRLLAWMFICFVVGLALIAIAPIVGQRQP